MNFTGFMFDDLWLPNISANSWRSRRVPLTKPQNLQMTSSRKNKSRRVCETAAVVKYFSCFLLHSVESSCENFNSPNKIKLSFDTGCVAHIVFHPDCQHLLDDMFRRPNDSPHILKSTSFCHRQHSRKFSIIVSIPCLACIWKIRKSLATKNSLVNNVTLSGSCESSSSRFAFRARS